MRDEQNSQDGDILCYLKLRGCSKARSHYEGAACFEKLTKRVKYRCSCSGIEFNT